MYLHNRPIVEYCAANGIRMTAYSPLARGAVVDDPVLQQIGAELGGTASQVALAWLMSKGYVVIPSAGSPARIAENLAASDLTLTAAQIVAIDALDKDMRLVDGQWCPVWDAA